MEKESTWGADIKKTKFPKLTKHLKVDVAIIGGGITGITSAYLLSKAGKSVALLEKNKICTGATGVTTAFITQSLDTETKKLIKMFGREKTKQVLQSHQDAIGFIKKTVKNNKIDCEFKECSNYIYSTNSGEKYLVEEMTALNTLGIKVALTRTGFPCDYPSVALPAQAKFHPLKYLYALAKIAKEQGTRTHEKTEVKDIIGQGPYILTTTSGKNIRAKQVIVATYWPLNRKLYFRKGTYNSYVMELQIPRGEFEEGMYEDDDNPYHYFRLDSMPGKRFDRMILGGEDRRADIPLPEENSFTALENYIKETFPNLKYKIVRKWLGPILEPIDGLASIGEGKPPGIYYGTGFSGNGMTYGTIAAKIFADSILGKKNPNMTLYRPYRMPSLYQLANKGLDYGQELLNGVARNLFKNN